MVSSRRETVCFVPEQGRSDFATAGVAGLRRGLQNRENADLGQKMPFLYGNWLGLYPKTQFAESFITGTIRHKIPCSFIFEKTSRNTNSQKPCLDRQKGSVISPCLE
jgi:hypothetical protein